MGAGKTAVGTALHQLLPRSAFLDGDWCWMLRPFVVTDETKAMVLDNIVHLMNNFIHCSVVDNVIFCWVMQEKAIAGEILSRLDLSGCQFELFTLSCSAEVLRRRLEADVAAGKRQPDAVERGLSYLSYYAGMDSTHIFTDRLTPAQAAEEIVSRLRNK